MDRRQQKTREAIFAAFGQLLERKSYQRITVQDIIDEANIGRSTFYAHFETKDELLSAMCRQIFEHVFAKGLTAEQSHDFSKGRKTLAKQLTHLLYHLREQQREITRLLHSESSGLLLRYFQEELEQLFAESVKKAADIVPAAFQLHYYASGFAETIRWWTDQGMQPTPEEMVRCYLALTNLTEDSL